MSLKTVLNDVLSQSGFLTKGSFVGSADPDDAQMVAIANRVADEIKFFYHWEALIKEETVTFTETGGVPDTLYELPADFIGYVPDSAWSTNGARKVDVPTKETEWYQIKNSSLSPGGIVKARFRMNVANPTPMNVIEIAEPTTGESISFNYVSNYPIISSTNTYKEYFTDDNDTFILGEPLLKLGVQAHWQQTKLMPQYKEHMVNYMKRMGEAIGRTVGSQIIGGVGRRRRFDPYYPLWRA